MKRVVLLIWLLAGVLGCSTDVITEVLPQSDSVDGIGLDLVTSVSRAMDTTAAAVRASENVDIYYYSEFYAEGTTSKIGNGASPIEFIYSNSEWQQSGSTTLYWRDLWGEGLSSEEDPKMFFYSLHCGQKLDAEGNNTVNESAPLKLGNASGDTAAASSNYTVKSDLSEQEDVVYCTEEYTELPIGGRISATFKHAMSRIEIYASTGDYNIYTTKVQLNSLYNTGKPTIYSEDYIQRRIATKKGLGVSDADLETTGLLIYNSGDIVTDIYGASPYRVSWDMTSHYPTTNYLFYDNEGSDELALIDTKLIAEGGVSTVATDAIVVPQTISASASDLSTFFESITGSESWYAEGYGAFESETEYDNFLTATTVDGMSGTWPYYYNTYIGKGYLDMQMVMVMYRSVDANDVGYNMVGCSKVSESMEYQKMVAAGYAVYPSTFDPGGEDADEPLYLLAGFPFGSDVMLEPGYDYDLCIDFQVSGGILLCDFYFLADGTMTNIPIDGIDPGDNVLGGTVDFISIVVTNTNGWGYDGTVDLNDNTNI